MGADKSECSWPQQFGQRVAALLRAVVNGVWWQTHWDAVLLAASAMAAAVVLLGPMLAPASPTLMVSVPASQAPVLGGGAVCPLPLVASAAVPAVGMVATSTVGAVAASGTTAKKTYTKKPAMVGKVALNTASSASLQRLPGIGPALAGRIVAYRQAHGPFSKVAHITKVKGIGAKTLKKLQPHLVL